MNLIQLASHTVDADLIRTPDQQHGWSVPVVLDVGCRWFDFSLAVVERWPSARVIAMDPAPDVAAAYSTGRQAIEFVPHALIGAGPPIQQLAHFSTGEGDFLGRRQHFAGWDVQPVFHDVGCLKIAELMSLRGVQRFDLVKLDCEGSEFGILENWLGPVATQISVEFHDWDKPQYRAVNYYDQLWKKLPWYRVVQHEVSKQGEGVGHWDTLLALR